MVLPCSCSFLLSCPPASNGSGLRWFVHVGPERLDYIWHLRRVHAIQGRKLHHGQEAARPGAGGTGGKDDDEAGKRRLGRRLKKTIVLIGMMGAGKTAVGNALARMLGVDFLDSDDEIERAANMPVSEIFQRDGEAFFRAREAEVLARLLSGRPCVLSTGGGAFLAEGNRTMIAEKGVAVWLKADLDLLWQRVRHKSTRPLLRTPDPKATLAELLTAREGIYAKAEITVEARPHYSIEEMAETVIEALSARPDILEAT